MYKPSVHSAAVPAGFARGDRSITPLASNEGVNDHLPSKSFQLLLDNFSVKRKHFLCSVEIVWGKFAICDGLGEGVMLGLYRKSFWSANKDGWLLPFNGTDPLLCFYKPGLAPHIAIHLSRWFVVYRVIIKSHNVVLAKS